MAKNLSKIQSHKNNRLCAEEALSRKKLQFTGFCLKHKEGLFLIRFKPKESRWYYECSCCLKEKDARVYANETKDPVNLARKRKNTEIFAKARREGLEVVDTFCNWHGRTKYRLSISGSGNKQANCKKCESCKTQFQRRAKKGLVFPLVQWVVVDESWNVPDAYTMELPKMDELMRRIIGDSKVYYMLENRWKPSRTLGLNIEHIKKFRFIGTPKFLYDSRKFTEHILIGNSAENLPHFRPVTTINLIRIKESVEDPVETFRMPKGFTEVSTSEWIKDGAFNVRLEQYNGRFNFD